MFTFSEHSSAQSCLYNTSATSQFLIIPCIKPTTMRAFATIPVFLALVASARGMALPGRFNADDDYEVTVMKRDAPLSTRDLEMAEMHGIDTNTSELPSFSLYEVLGLT